MADFDAYLMVDWSASSRPRRGKDSVWYCLVTRDGARLHVTDPENPPTRHEAVQRIHRILAGNMDQNLSTLVGFDFPYGYPRGFGTALGFKANKGPVWRQVWDLLCQLTKDDEHNYNNRFEAAAELNKRISGRNYPFWGSPERSVCPTLSRRKLRGVFNSPLPEKRITEQRTGTAKSAWQLLGQGSVGSQALLGVPHLARLRDDPRLAKASCVWPFETGMRKLPPRKKRDWLVLHAEIYPSIVRLTVKAGEVTDAAYVRELAMHFAQLEEKGELSRLFEGPHDLGDEERQIAESEEGWILGV